MSFILHLVFFLYTTPWRPVGRGSTLPVESEPSDVRAGPVVGEPGRGLLGGWWMGRGDGENLIEHYIQITNISPYFTKDFNKFPPRQVKKEVTDAEADPEPNFLPT